MLYHPMSFSLRVTPPPNIAFSNRWSSFLADSPPGLGAWKLCSTSFKRWSRLVCIGETQQYKTRNKQLLKIINYRNYLVSANTECNCYSRYTGDVKFRADNNWEASWGNSFFPNEKAVLSGPNIPIPVAGTYLVTFNDSTRNYTFTIISKKLP